MGCVVGGIWKSMKDGSYNPNSGFGPRQCGMVWETASRLRPTTGRGQGDRASADHRFTCKQAHLLEGRTALVPDRDLHVLVPHCPQPVIRQVTS